MELSKHIDYNPGKQIWRILITDDEKVVIEKRDTEDKQVYFDCFELDNKKKVFENLQMAEKFWIGIEKIYKGIIFFHKFTKPDMPGHKEIIAYDIEKDEVLWQNEEYAFLFVFENKVYGFKELFEGRKFVSFDYKSGKLIEELGSNVDEINRLYDKARAEEDYSDYTFPTIVPPKNPDVESQIDNLKSKLAIVGDVEYNILNSVLFVSYHQKQSEDKMTNKFAVMDVESGRELMNKTLTADVDSFMMDSFFIYKDYLFLLMEKSKVEIHKLSS